MAGGETGKPAITIASLTSEAHFREAVTLQKTIGGCEDIEVRPIHFCVWAVEGGGAGQWCAGRTAGGVGGERNTVLNRLRRVESLTGRSLEDVDSMVEWRLALLARTLGRDAPSS